MFFGVSMSPMGWFITLMIALVSLMIPFAIIEYIASFFPSPINDILSFLMAAIGLPALLCWMYSRKLFAKGRASALFWIYTLLYASAGLVALLMPGSEDVPRSFSSRIAGIPLVIIGLGMFFWSRKERQKFDIAVADADHAMKEEQINMQAEAILRAEQLKKERGL